MTEGEYEDFFRVAYPKLVGLGLAMSVPRQIAQDLAQETMMRAYVHRDRLAHLEAPYAWCRRVMCNLLIDQHRSSAAEQRAISRLASDLPARSDHDDEPKVHFDRRWEDMLEPLSMRQRCVATLYYAEDRSVADIADDLGWSVGSVKTTLARIRRKLAERLGHGDRHEAKWS